jgi:murein tripeptide amidase MpaA
MQTESGSDQKIRELTTKRPEENQFLQNERFFLQIKRTLLKSSKYCGKFVAVYDGKIVSFDENRVKLAIRVYNSLGYVPIYIGKVEREKETVELPSPEV